jgi:Tol biopolymer transport system component
MNTSLHFNDWSRFDRAVLLTVLGALLLVAALLLRGDRVGVRIAAVYPAEQAANVSVRSGVRVIFSQEMAIGPESALELSPPVPGVTRWDGRTLAFVPAEPLEPGTTYTVTVAAGLESRQGRPFLQPYTWHFETGQSRILHITWDEEDRSQIAVVNPDGRGSRQLTDVRYGVVDFAVAPDGMSIIYAVLREDGGSDLHLIDSDGANLREVLDCADAACSGASWLPDGRRLVYERRNMTVPGVPPGPPRLWWLDVQDGQTAPVFQDNQWLGLGARASNSGDWLAYVVPLEQEIQIYNLNSGRTLRVTSRMGQPGNWHPYEDWLLVNDIQLEGDRYAVHLYLVNLDNDQLQNLSGSQDNVNDNWPIWSPDGEWIAFGRREPGVPMGSQLWLMRADGSESRPLTQDPEINYSSASWSPDGRFLLFQRFLLQDPGRDPGIWLLEVNNGRMWEVVGAGVQPAWLP